MECTIYTVCYVFLEMGHFHVSLPAKHDASRHNGTDIKSGSSLYLYVAASWLLQLIA